VKSCKQSFIKTKCSNTRPTCLSTQSKKKNISTYKKHVHTHKQHTKKIYTIVDVKIIGEETPLYIFLVEWEE